MAYKIFLDVNIVLDVLHADREFHEDAKELFLQLENNNLFGYYSESVVTTVAYVLRKKMMPPQINEIILYLNQKVSFLPCNQSLINKAVHSNPSDFEDALLYEIALHHQLDYFITSNIKDFKKVQRAGLPVIRAKEFNKLLG